ncbi:four helix bundle protein [Dasania marina]|uniref:four helix bundle protein n=1 Tax=Dasania marina TaxID=471499 RepID=UPI00037C75DD|nr:four helix bundle protein [Dasania marina]
MNFEKLDVWKRSLILSSSLYKAFAGHNDFGFRDQITRSGLLIPSNITEGMERDTSPDKARFLTMAKASCAELRTQLLIAKDIGYLNQHDAQNWIAESYEISRMLAGLIKRVKP